MRLSLRIVVCDLTGNVSSSSPDVWVPFLVQFSFVNLFLERLLPFSALWTFWGGTTLFAVCWQPARGHGDIVGHLSLSILIPAQSSAWFWNKPNIAEIAILLLLNLLHVYIWNGTLFLSCDTHEEVSTYYFILWHPSSLGSHNLIA